MRRWSSVAAVALWCGVASADIPPPGQSECRGKKPGDSCKVDGLSGVCEASKCSRPDYSKGPPPSYVEVDCVLCRPKKKSERDVSAPVALGAGLALAAGAGALLLRRRRR